MLENILGFINFILILVFGVYVSAAFTGIALNKKNNFIFLGFTIVSIVIQTVVYGAYGMEITEKLYPLIIHLPLILFLAFYYKRKLLPSVVAVMSAYLCCQLTKWIGILTRTFTDKLSIYLIVKNVLIIIVGVLIIRYIAPSLAVILSKSQKTVLIFSILPLTYYIFDYSVTVYTNLLYSGSQTVFEFLPFILCISYLIFCVVYFKEYEEKCDSERRNQLMEIRSVQSMKEIEAMRRSEYEVSRIRHDMRHFLNNINAYIQSGTTSKALKYIDGVIATIDQTTIKKFCDNDLANMVLSYYESCMKEKEVQFVTSVKIPPELPISEMDFNSILANGLENALEAVKDVEPERRIITLDLKMNNDKLLLSIKNPYLYHPKMVDGMPVTDRHGHGLGTQSIKYVAEKLQGNCQFTIKDNQFILRVVL
ncbi:MAG: ATP-binding protein [Oscillospiraceae bacterium]